MEYLTKQQIKRFHAALDKERREDKKIAATLSGTTRRELATFVEVVKTLTKALFHTVRAQGAAVEAARLGSKRNAGLRPLVLANIIGAELQLARASGLLGLSKSNASQEVVTERDRFRNALRRIVWTARRPRDPTDTPENLAGRMEAMAKLALDGHRVAPTGTVPKRSRATRGSR